MSDPFVIAICNRKGGSGKTTTAVNLAAEYAARGRRTLLVDLDTQGHAGIGGGVIPARGGATAHGIFGAPPFSLSQAIRPSAHDNLSIAPADDRFLSSRGGDTAALAQQLGRIEIATQFDLVVIDTPPSLDLPLLAALEAAHGVVVPMLLHPLSEQGVRQLTRLIWRVATTANPNLTRLAVLPVLINIRVNLQKTVLAQMIAQYGPEKILKGIRPDITLSEAFADHVPVRAFAPRSRGALDYHLLANELSALWRWDHPPTPIDFSLNTVRTEPGTRVQEARSS